ICEEEPYYPPKVNQNIEAIMVCLLMKDVHNRLGSTGLQEFKEYEFYAKFDFDALREKKLKAPFSKPFPKFGGLKEEEIVGWNFEGKKGIKDFKNFDYTAPELIKEKKKGRKRVIEEEEKENLPAKRVRKPKNLSLEGF
uniref:AGC-kinase C-terminal domain-containing protein n=2 Tax=Bursaphelenchus xylophilus TaxID=6326 RepID=A0A1I7SPB4_BURXY